MLVVEGGCWVEFCCLGGCFECEGVWEGWRGGRRSELGWERRKGRCRGVRREGREGGWVRKEGKSE